MHADTRGDLLPDPEMDAVRIIFYAVFDDIPPDKGRRNITGALVVDKESCTVVSARKSPQPSTSGGSATLPPDGKGKQTLFEKCAILEELDVTYVESEEDLLKEFTDLISRCVCMWWVWVCMWVGVGVHVGGCGCACMFGCLCACLCWNVHKEHVFGRMSCYAHAR